MEQSLHPFSSYTLPWFQLLLLCSYIVLADIAIQTHILSFILIIIRCQSAQSYRKCADKSKGYSSHKVNSFSELHHLVQCILHGDARICSHFKAHCTPWQGKNCCTSFMLEHSGMVYEGSDINIMIAVPWWLKSTIIVLKRAWWRFYEWFCPPLGHQLNCVAITSTVATWQ